MPWRKPVKSLQDLCVTAIAGNLGEIVQWPSPESLIVFLENETLHDSPFDVLRNNITSHHNQHISLFIKLSTLVVMIAAPKLMSVLLDVAMEEPPTNIPHLVLLVTARLESLKLSTLLKDNRKVASTRLLLKAVSSQSVRKTTFSII